MEFSLVGAKLMGSRQPHQPVYFVITWNGLSVLLSSRPNAARKELLAERNEEVGKEAGKGKGGLGEIEGGGKHAAEGQKNSDVPASKETEDDTPGQTKSDRDGSSKAKGEGNAEKPGKGKENGGGKDNEQGVEKTNEPAAVKEEGPKHKSKFKFRSLARAVRAAAGMMDNKGHRLGMYR